MAEDFWKNSHFSVAKYSGRIKFNDHTYTIVDKHGVDIFTLSAKAKKEGITNAIDPGEPCDLVRDDWRPLYRKVGRDRFIQLVDESGGDLKKAKALAKAMKTCKPTEK